MSTVDKSMAKAANSGESTNQNAGKSANAGKYIPGPAKKGGKQGNKGKAFR
ncbi:MAG: hypothetical protein WC390_08655 [Sulfurimonas sp.]|jgi:hypothetical protein